MSTVDEIEYLGTLVAAGEITEETATQRLTEFSDGGLTKLGAQDMIRRSRTARAEYGRIFEQTKAALEQLRQSGGAS